MRIGRTIPPAAAPIYLSDFIDGFRGIIKGQQEVERFERELRDYFNVKHCFLVSSGRAALTLILKALHSLYPERDEVIIPAFSCYSVPAAIVRAGLKVRLCDIDPNTLDFNFHELERIIGNGSKSELSSKHESGTSSHKTRQGSLPSINGYQTLLAIIPVHLFGVEANVKFLKKLVLDPAVTVIEDAAQVLGADRNGYYMGTIGDVGFFSLGRGKALSAIEGGVIITNDENIGTQISFEAEKAEHYTLYENLKLFLQALGLFIFQRPSLFWFPKALPFLRLGETIYDPDFKVRKLTPFQAGVTRAWKAKLLRYSEIRRAYSKDWAKLKTLQIFTDYQSCSGQSKTFIRFPIRIKNSATWRRLRVLGEKKGLGIILTYPDALHRIAELQKEFEGQDYPAARKLSRQLLTLPVHPMLSPRDRIKIKTSLQRVAKYGDTQ